MGKTIRRNKDDFKEPKGEKNLPKGKKPVLKITIGLLKPKKGMK